jgi:hypothetical protein
MCVSARTATLIVYMMRLLSQVISFPEKLVLSHYPTYLLYLKVHFYLDKSMRLITFRRLVGRQQTASDF